LRRKITGLKRKFKQFAPRIQVKMREVSSNNMDNITVTNLKNIAAAVNTWPNHSSQKVFPNQVAHINQENSWNGARDNRLQTSYGGHKEMDKDVREFKDEELEDQEATDLPNREAMSLINANAAVPVNAGVAANVLSDHSTATATPTQNVPIDQKITD